MSAACCFDLALPCSGRDVAASYRERRRRIGKQLAHQRLLKAGQVDRCGEDGTNVVFRRPNASYVSCAFLDEHDTVVALDSRGYADLVRLPPFDGSIVPRRAQGTLLTSQLSAATSHGSLSTQFKIQSLQNGKAFAVGTEYGDFRILATERASQMLPKALLDSKQQWSLGSVSQGDSGCDETKWRGWQIPGPIRRYHRNFDFILADQLQNPNNLSHLLEVYNWQDPTTFLFNELGRPTVPESEWDFWETPSSLLALHVGRYHDNFSLRILDERDTAQKDQVCFDMDAIRDSHNASVCFVNDQCVACAVEEHQDGHLPSMIKLFDLRMVKGGAASSTTVFPSFPRSSANGLHANEVFDVMYENDFTAKVVAAKERPPSRRAPLNPLLWDLNRLHDGSLMVTTIAGLHFVFDCTKRTVVTVKEEDKKIHSDGPPLYAVDKQHGTVAVYEASVGPKQAIELYTGKEKGQNRHRGHKRKCSHDYCSKIETGIQDCYGLQTELSCMAFNESGTSIVGASKDGDIFAWRA